MENFDIKPFAEMDEVPNTLNNVLHRAGITNLRELREFQHKHKCVVLDLVKFRGNLLFGVTEKHCQLLEKLLNK